MQKENPQSALLRHKNTGENRASQLIPRKAFLQAGLTLAALAAQKKWPLVSELWSQSPVNITEIRQFDLENIEKAFVEIDRFAIDSDPGGITNFFKPGMELAEFTDQLRRKTQPILGTGGSDLFGISWDSERALRIIPQVDLWHAFIRGLLVLMQQELAATNPVSPISPRDGERLIKAAADIARAMEAAAPFTGLQQEADSVFRGLTQIVITEQSSVFPPPLIWNKQIAAFEAQVFAEKLRRFQGRDSGYFEDMRWTIQNAFIRLEQIRFQWKSVYSELQILQLAQTEMGRLPAESEKITGGQVESGPRRLIGKSLNALFFMELAVRRMQLLARTQSSGVFTATQRQYGQMEVSSLIDSCNILEKRAAFGSRQIFDGSFQATIPRNTGRPASIAIPQINSVQLKLQLEAGAKLTISTMQFSSEAVGVLGDALRRLSETRKMILDSLK